MKDCTPEEAALKSFFLGPQSENSTWLSSEISKIFQHWFLWRRKLYPQDGCAISEHDKGGSEFLKTQLKVSERLEQLFTRFETEVPQYSPRYIGHMYSEVSLPAILGHIVALVQNPNLISSEAAKVGALIEEEAISDLVSMVGFPTESGTGHFTSGGTIANIEALWRARYRMDHFLSLGVYLNLKHDLKISFWSAAHMGWTAYEAYLQKFDIQELDLRQYSCVVRGSWDLKEVYNRAFGGDIKSPIVLVPNSKHYSWLKAISLLGLGEDSFTSVELDRNAVLDVADLNIKIRKAQDQSRPILMVVSVAGTTELGVCDPIHEVQNLLDSRRLNNEEHIWHHVDAAYGGYFCSLFRVAISSNSESDIKEKHNLPSHLEQSFKGIGRVDSVTLDPHKLGYVPYSCGALLVPNSLNYRVSSFAAKYIQSPNQRVDRWMKTLEGSRSAAGAAATWMTSKTIGFYRSGYGAVLGRTIAAQRHLKHSLACQCGSVRFLRGQDLNLLCLVYKGNSTKLSAVNENTQRLIEFIDRSQLFFISKTELGIKDYSRLIHSHCQDWDVEMDSDSMVLLRITIMNPFFENQESTVNYLNEFNQLVSSFCL